MAIARFSTPLIALALLAGCASGAARGAGWPGPRAESRLTILHENQMGTSFRLVRAVYALDGAPIYSRSDDGGSLGEHATFGIYDGRLPGGPHRLEASLDYRLHGYGVFSYLDQYRVRVRSSHSFEVPAGHAVTLHVIGYERESPAAPIEARPSLQYRMTVEGAAL